MDKLIARLGQRQRCLGFSHADHIFLLFSQAHGQLGKITVTGNQTKAVHLTGIKDIHGINNHGHIRSIFSYRIIKLLDWVNRVLQEGILLPAVPLCPVSVNTAI